MTESNAASHAGIISRQKTKDGKTLADFEKDNKLRFEIYKITMDEIYKILKKEDGLLSIPLESLEDYAKAFIEIENVFFDFYSNILKKVTPDQLQPLIDQSSTKLTMAVYYKKKNNEEECLNKLKECRLLLFKLVEIVEASTPSDADPASSPK